jgi:hypothetical protein
LWRKEISLCQPAFSFSVQYCMLPAEKIEFEILMKSL